MIVYSNSCSFGAPQEHITYGEYVSNHLGGEFINKGIQGSCNRRIIRTTLRDLNELKSSNKEIIALVGLTFLSRTELWREDLDVNDNDGHFHSLTINHSNLSWKDGLNTEHKDVHKYIDSSVSGYYKEWLYHYNRESAMTELLTDINMLVGWLNNHNIRYSIFSNVDKLEGEEFIGYTSPFISSLRSSIENDKNIIDLWNFSFGSYSLENGFKPKDEELYGIHGHPNEDAHKTFGKYLLQKLI